MVKYKANCDIVKIMMNEQWMYKVTWWLRGGKFHFLKRMG